MAEQGEPELQEVPEGDDEVTPGYKPPAEKNLEDIIKADDEDESLKKYKQQLLGSAANQDKIEIEPDNPNRVIVKKLTLVIDGHDEMNLDLSQDKEAIKNTTFVLKEGCNYKVKISFYVQREIVSGLRYFQSVHRKGIRVDKGSFMVGSYGPKREMQSYLTPSEEAPSGMLSRGTYKIHSKFTDDDKNSYLEWEWSLKIAKDWE